MDLELVAAFPSLMEAQIACSALQAAGVNAQLMDQNYSTIFPTAHIGGYRIAAPIGEGRRARRLLESILEEGSQDDTCD
jgi:hypothetical protein